MASGPWLWPFYRRLHGTTICCAPPTAHVESLLATEPSCRCPVSSVWDQDCQLRLTQHSAKKGKSCSVTSASPPPPSEVNLEPVEFVDQPSYSSVQPMPLTLFSHPAEMGNVLANINTTLLHISPMLGSQGRGQVVTDRQHSRLPSGCPVHSRLCSRLSYPRSHVPTVSTPCYEPLPQNAIPPAQTAVTSMPATSVPPPALIVAARSHLSSVTVPAPHPAIDGPTAPALPCIRDIRSQSPGSGPGRIDRCRPYRSFLARHTLTNLSATPPTPATIAAHRIDPAQPRMH